MNVPVSSHKELKWKLKNGELKPLNELSNEELKLFAKISYSKATAAYKTYEFFNEMLTQIDKEVHNRIVKAEELVQELKQIEEEI